MRLNSDKVSMDIDSHEATAKTRVDKNTHLKGRRRFKADLDDMIEETKVGFGYFGFMVKSTRLQMSSSFIVEKIYPELRPGDDEGSVEVTIHNMHAQRVLSLNMLVSGKSSIKKPRP
jgi:ubiquitin-conjugating enzyme E2 Q